MSFCILKNERGIKFLRVSYATAVEMNLKKGKINASNYTAYLLVGEKCLYNCSFCSKAKESSSEEDLLSRVKWPEVSTEDFVHNFNPGNFKRICIQVVSSLEYRTDLNYVLNFLKDKNIKVSVSIRPKNLEEVRLLFNKYLVDTVGIAIDSANEKLFRKIKGGNFKIFNNLLIKASEEFPGKIATHIIVGLGESDEDIVDILLKMKEHKIIVSLFAFTPIKGTKLETHPRPTLERYRKMQYLHYIIEHYNVEKEAFTFDSKGNILQFPHFTINNEEMIKTSGCSWCTRPFYNEQPGKELYNVPIPRI